MPKPTSREIDDVAARWAARADRGPLSAQDQQALDAWMAGDTRRLGAYARARAIALHTERAQALGPSYDPASFVTPAKAPMLSRRNALWAGAAAASLAGVGAVGLLVAGPRRYNTRRGEMRVVSLEDGSVMTLNTASRIEVGYSRRARNVRLLEGEALFDVARDAQRPFLVMAGDTQVRAVGTSFTVRRLGDTPVEVLVREGVVEVNQAQGPARPPVRLSANSRAVAPEARAPISAVSLAPSDISRELSWREGRIAFEGDTLSQAAGEFARYSDTRIVIDDPEVGRQEITGLFVANDPIGFAKAAAVSLGLRATVGEDEVRLSR